MHKNRRLGAVPPKPRDRLSRRGLSAAELKKEQDRYSARRGATGSGYRFVFSAGSKWQVRVALRGKKHYVGVFSDATEGARAGDRKAVELGYPRDNINFPDEFERHVSVLNAMKTYQSNSSNGGGGGSNSSSSSSSSVNILPKKSLKHILVKPFKKGSSSSSSSSTDNGLPKKTLRHMLHVGNESSGTSTPPLEVALLPEAVTEFVKTPDVIGKPNYRASACRNKSGFRGVYSTRKSGGPPFCFEVFFRNQIFRSRTIYQTAIEAAKEYDAKVVRLGKAKIDKMYLNFPQDWSSEQIKSVVTQPASYVHLTTKRKKRGRDAQTTTNEKEQDEQTTGNERGQSAPSLVMAGFRSSKRMRQKSTRFNSEEFDLECAL